MHGLRVKGMADAAAVAQRFALDRELVDELLLDYEASDGSHRALCRCRRMVTDFGVGLAEDARRLRPSWTRPAHAHRLWPHMRCSSHSTCCLQSRSQTGRSGRGEGISWRQMITPTGPEDVGSMSCTVSRVGCSLCCGSSAALARFGGYTERYSAALDRVDRANELGLPNPRSTPAIRCGWNSTRTCWPLLARARLNRPMSISSVTILGHAGPAPFG